MSIDLTGYDNEHHRIWELLPALVNGTADGEQTRRVERHLAHCADCRAGLAREQLIHKALNLPAAQAPDVELGLLSLSRRLDQLGQPGPFARAPRQLFPRLGGMTLVGVGLVELVALAAILIAGARLAVPAGNGSPAAYRTLSDATTRAPAAVQLRIVFDAARPLGDFQSALLAQDLVVVDGPSESGVWSLGFRSGKHDAEGAAHALRQIPGVMFAEPVGLPGS